MKIYGLTGNECKAIALEIGGRFDVTRSEARPKAGPLTLGRFLPGEWEGKGKARTKRYSVIRESRWGGRRRVNAACFHGQRDFIRECFAFGATRIQTIFGDWRSAAAFEVSLPELAHYSGGFDQEMVECCECPAPDTECARCGQPAHYSELCPARLAELGASERLIEIDSRENKYGQVSLYIRPAVAS